MFKKIYSTLINQHLHDITIPHTQIYFLLVEPETFFSEDFFLECSHNLQIYIICFIFRILRQIAGENCNDTKANQGSYHFQYTSPKIHLYNFIHCMFPHHIFFESAVNIFTFLLFHNIWGICVFHFNYYRVWIRSFVEKSFN